MTISFHKNSLWSIIPFSLIALSQACGKGPGTTCEESSTFGCTTTIPDTGSTETGDSGTGTDTTTSSPSTTEQESQSGGNSEGESDSTTTDGSTTSVDTTGTTSMDGSTTSVNTGTTSMDGSTTSMDTTGEDPPLDCNDHLDAKLYDEVGGFGIEANPYIICTALQLTSIAQGGAEALGAHYKVARSIDLAQEYYNNPNNPQFTIGNANNSFHGSFDGGADQGYSISGFKWIQQGNEQESIGLFGSLSFNAVIKNLYLKQVSIDAPFSLVGGIVGRTSGISTKKIQNCAVEGTLHGFAVGGITGQVETELNIEQSHFNGSITGDRAGGLVGHLPFSGGTLTILNSYAGTLQIEENTPLLQIKPAFSGGGLVGAIVVGASLVINNSYANMHILPEESGIYVGGLVGHASTLFPDTSQLTIHNSYATGIVGFINSPYKAGIIGTTDFTNIDFENVHWVNFAEHNDGHFDEINMANGFADDQCYRYDVNNVTQNGSDGCVSTKMKSDFYSEDAAVYQTWDFNIWASPNNSFSLLPILQWEIAVLENP